MGQSHGLHAGRIEPEMAIAINRFVALALVHPTLQQDALAIDLEQMPRSGRCLCSPVEGEFHRALLSMVLRMASFKSSNPSLVSAEMGRTSWRILRLNFFRF